MRWEEPVTSYQTLEGLFPPLPLRPYTSHFLSESQLPHLQNRTDLTWGHGRTRRYEPEFIL